MRTKILTVFATLAILLASTGLFTVANASDQQKLMIDSASAVMKLAAGDDAAQLEIDGETVYFVQEDIYDITDTVELENGDIWYQVRETINGIGYDVYVCSDDVYLLDMEFESNMIAQDFPEDYICSLRKIHREHPQWNFIAYQTGIAWETMLNKQDVLRKNLISGSNIYLRSTAEGCYNSETGEYIPLDGKSWYQANRETIAYYIDPRNFLNETRIFMFLQLSFSENETEDLVQGILNNTFMSDNDPVDDIPYKTIFYQAGETYNASPIYLAALAKQEQGVNGSAAITGAEFTYNNVTYSGLYNFFNIGATAGTDNWKKGLVYANGGTDGSAATYDRPWTSPQKSINGGAQWISNGYISKGQDTMYFQKFNCTTYQRYTHQYMTNVQAAYSQSASMHKTYENCGALDSELNFKIPVYNNMPEETALPTAPAVIPDPEPDPEPDPDPDPQPDPDPTPMDPTSNFITDLNLTENEGTLSGFTLGMTYGELKNIVSQSSQGTVKLYDGSSEAADTAVLATGQILVHNDGETEESYTVLIKGDLDGDGIISTRDYLIYRKTLLGIYEMDPLQIMAACVNGESTISTRGYLIIRKYLLGVLSINQ